jgi:hypothetical protein
VDAVATKVAVAEEAPPASDFNGTWCMTDVQGDFDRFLADAGVGWASRRMAKSMNWGIGKTFQQISQSGNDFVIANASPLKSTTMEFKVGAGYQQTTGVDGLPALVKAQWDGQSLTMQYKKPDGQEFAPACRYIRGNKMVIEAPISTGSTVKRIYTKQ